MAVISIDSVEGFRCSYSFQIMQKAVKVWEKLPLLISLAVRHGSYLIIVILIIPALPLEWKQQELLRSLVHQKKSIDYITSFFMDMLTAWHILHSKIYMVQLNLSRSLNVSVTIKNVSVRGFIIWKNNTKGLAAKGKFINIKINTMQNFFALLYVVM